MPEDQRPKTPADIEVEEFTKIPESEKKVSVESTVSGAANPMLHPEDYEGMNAILDRASKMQLNELVIRKGDFNMSMRSGNDSAKGHVISESNVESTPEEIKESVQKTVEKRLKKIRRNTKILVMR